MEEYKIEKITARDEMEQLGTKEKIWFDENDKIKKLFKIGRFGTGENWSEKIAYELAVLLKIPCAKYEFAIGKDIEGKEKQGTVSTSFVPKGARLVHGNELLVKFYNDEYPQSERYHLTDYKLSVVLDLIDNELNWLELAEEIEDEEISKPIDMFIGYLIFDTWISNQDRHHENWGIILSKEDVYFAHTYDHAAGLGSKVSDEEADSRLKTNDVNYSVKKFVTRAKTPFYDDNNKKMKTIDVARILIKKYPTQTCYWIDKIEKISQEDINNILEKVPAQFMSSVSKKFASSLLYENRKRLCNLRREVSNEKI